jgi:hypothetical protein
VITCKHALHAMLFALLTNAALLTPEKVIAGEQPAAGTITLDVLVNNDYDDSEESLQLIRSLLQLPFLEKIELPPSVSIEEYMYDRYEFGPRQLPKSFALLRAAIEELNESRGPADPWLVPSLPRRRKPELNPHNPYYELPRVAIFNVVDQVNGGLAVEQEGNTEDESRRGSQYTLLQYTMPRGVYDTLPAEVKSLSVIHGVSRQLAPIDMPVDSMDKDIDHAAPPPIIDQANTPSVVSIDEAPILLGGSEELRLTETNELSEMHETISYSSDIQGPDFWTNTAPVSRIESLGANAGALRMASIPDATRNYNSTSVPTPRRLIDAATQNSLQLDQRLAAFKRHTYLLVLDDGWPNEPSMKASISFIEAALNRRRPMLGVEKIALAVPAGVSYDNHSAEVYSALEELDDLAKSTNPVKTYYMPVLLNDSTEPIIEQLLIFDYLLRYLPQNFAKPIQKPNPLEGSAKDWAVREIESWKKAKELTGDQFSTHAGVINAIYRLGESLAAAEKTVFVVSQSWTIRGNILSLAPTSRSITVAATGNDGVDVLASNIDFAQRCAHDDGFLAVMYANAAGDPDCGSGIVTEDDEVVKNVRVVAYNGELPNGECGTSFATPRVAWFLAAKSGLMAQYTDDWQKRLQDSLRNIRPGGARWKNIYFDVLRFWE